MSTQQSKRGAALIVEPSSQVHFPGPPLRPSRATIKLINNTTNRIAFKIKTTAPSFYGVRPSSGVVLPRNTAEVEIARQPFTHEQSPKISHKFMVQSLMVPDDVDDVSKLWLNVNTTHLGIHKLRCVFEDPPARSTSEQPRSSKDKEPKIKINDGEAPAAARKSSEQTQAQTNSSPSSSRRGSPQKVGSPLKLSSIKENKIEAPTTQVDSRKSQESKASTSSGSGSGGGGNKKPLVEGNNSNQSNLSGVTSKTSERKTSSQAAGGSMQPRKPSESMESIRRIMEGKENKKKSTSNEEKAEVEQKKSSWQQNEKIGSNKQLPLNVLDTEVGSGSGGGVGKQKIQQQQQQGLKNAPTASKKSENLQRSDQALGQSRQGSMSSPSFKPLISYHSNDTEVGSGSGGGVGKQKLQQQQGIKNAPTASKKSENLQRSDQALDQSRQASLTSPSFKPLISYHSNDSTSAVSTNAFSPKLSPVRLPSPTQQQQQKQQPQMMTMRQSKPNKKEKTEREAQTSLLLSDDSGGGGGGGQKSLKQKSGDIFTALQFATMNTEIHQLRRENKYLNRENSVLKEEIQHRKSVQPAVRSEYIVPHSELLQPQHSLPLSYIVASMTFAILCLVLGKFVL